MRASWEYMILVSLNAPGGGMFKEKSKAAVEKYLNELGAEGWEIVNIELTEREDRLSFIGLAKRMRSDG